MGFLHSSDSNNTKNTINEYAKIEKQTPNAQLFDVRTPNEFAQGHLPGAKNVPLDQISTLPDMVPDKATPLFLYCRSGRRSGMACKYMQQQGYTNVTNMGGILDWKGDVEK